MGVAVTAFFQDARLEGAMCGSDVNKSLSRGEFQYRQETRDNVVKCILLCPRTSGQVSG